MQKNIQTSRSTFGIYCGICLLLLLSSSFDAACQILEVGTGKTYDSIQAAANDAIPGDTILVDGGSYAGGMLIQNLEGTPEAWITIKPRSGEEVIIEGGNNSIQFSQVAYLHVIGLTATGQRANGMNIDDGGSFDTPSHHLRIENCTFRDMGANGNNDLLKMSGIDSFWVEKCLFLNGADGGSGLDMVGCHEGFIRECRFENMGNNGIQAKGGTQHIRIERNTFKNAGLRNINLGGSTGLAFFRPRDAPFEAADLQVYANVFIGGWAGLAYVGCTRVEVANNTFYYPENWVFRILQETVDTNRFVSCGNNNFTNNMVVYGDVNRDVNIGANTRPESFTIDYNLWYKPDHPDFTGPQLPVNGPSNLIQVDPLLQNPLSEDFNIDGSSPAIGNGIFIEMGLMDHDGDPYAYPPSIGAQEGLIVNTQDAVTLTDWTIFPNPFFQSIRIKSNSGQDNFTYQVYSSEGKRLLSGEQNSSSKVIPLGQLKSGLYYLRLTSGNQIQTTPILKR
ncbi:MAG TPA: right-handed parallel beta-helix repeat-containing protein [Saprospiraceae bacterium]|nr:right-handed parallel beta-helix repeat-containing protein [Saprospiraceae bacterium]